MTHLGASISAGIKVKPLKRVDSRQCACCGAVYGRCEHTEGQSCEDVIWMHVRNPAGKQSEPWKKWEQAEDDRLIYYWGKGYSYTKIADLMNKTIGAIKGRTYKLSLGPRTHMQGNG